MPVARTLAALDHALLVAQDGSYIVAEDSIPLAHTASSRRWMPRPAQLQGMTTPGAV